MKHIIIVDDEQEILTILERFLSRKYKITSLTNPVEALNTINTGNFDLVLTDIMMPQITGLELLKKIRSANNNVPVIMMTAFDTMDKALEAHTYGASNYIKKPFSSLNDVLSKIEDVI